MKILIVAVGSHGDVLPFIALGVELHGRGHTVKLAAPAPFEPMAVRAGLTFHSLGTWEDYQRQAADPRLWHPRRGVKAVFAAAMAAAGLTYNWLASEWQAGQGIVVASTLSLGARIASDKLGLALVTVHLAPMLVESRHDSPILPGVPFVRFLPTKVRHWIGRGADTYVIDPAILPELNAFRATLHLRPVKRLRHWWNAERDVILMFPEWYAARQADWPAQSQQVGFPMADRFGDSEDLDEGLATFLDEGEPPLVFTYGSAMRQATKFFDDAVTLCARMGRRGVFLAPQADQVSTPLPSTIIHRQYAPLSLLLPRCAALVHHGGVGTVVQGLAAGIPQLISPVAFNHFDDGRRVERLGVGTMLSRPFTSDRALRALNRLLSSSRVAESCAAVRKRMARENGLDQACDVVERAAGYMRPDAQLNGRMLARQGHETRSLAVDCLPALA